MTDKEFLIKLHMKKYKDKWNTCEYCGRQSDIKVSLRTKRIKWSCNHYSSPLRGTFLHKTSIDIAKFLELLRTFLDSKHGISSVAAGEILGKSQPTAWKILKRIRENIEDVTFQDDEVIQIDEMFLGSSKRYSRKQKIKQEDLSEYGEIASKQGIKSRHRAKTWDKKKVILGVRGSSGTYYAKYIGMNVSGMAELKNRKNRDQFYGEWRKVLTKIGIKNKRVYHDGDITLSKIIKELGGRPFVVVHNKHEYVKIDKQNQTIVTTNAIEGYFGRLKRTFKGVYTSATNKHIQKYLNEYNYKYTFRKNLSKRFIQKTFKIH